MKRTLVLAILLVSMFTMVNPAVMEQDHEIIPVSFERPMEEFVDTGIKNDLTIRFDRELNPSEIAFYEANGIDFGDEPQNVGSVYLVKASDAALEHLKDDPFLRSAEPVTQPFYHSPRDVSVTETFADLAWQMQDFDGIDLTGEDILIADLDTGIDWHHPDFFFADGPQTNYFETAHLPPDMFIFNNGTDGIDINGNFAIENNEKLYVTDIDKNGAFHVEVDWLWLDNGTTVGSIDYWDTWFVVNDTDSDTQLTGVDNLIRLQTPKTKYIVHKPGGSYIQVWDRDVNITMCTSQDTDGHGTGVAGILNGGQLGYRKFVGIAPNAELMAINIFGNDGLTVEEGLIWARDHGADVILIEIGSWTYEFLDGSSNVEVMIDTLTAQGIPVIVPAGNLQNCGRHTHSALAGGTPLGVQFVVPAIGATEVYITILSDAPVDSAIVTITEPTSTGTMSHVITLGVGYWNWWSVPTTNVTFDAFLANSTRGTNYMIAIDIAGWIKDTSAWTLTLQLPTAANVDFYISDDASSWGGGAAWVSPTNTHLITWPSTADTAISVASYHSRNLWMPGYGMLATYSSIGPRIDGIPKLSVAAPGGYDIISPWSFDAPYPSWYTQGYSGLPLYSLYGGYQLFSGTSAAGPHVAGAVALMLQLNGDCGSIAKDLIEASAYTDAYTGLIAPYPSPGNFAWGYGKLNACAAIEEVLKLPRIHEITITPNNPSYADTVTLSINASSVTSVLFDWSFDNWMTAHPTPLTLSGGLYTTTIPAHQYGTTINYRFFPSNVLAVTNPTIEDSYIVDDSVAPSIDSFVHNATATVVDPTWIAVSVQASEPVNASGIAGVAIEFTVDNWVSTNIVSLVFNGTSYVGHLPPAPIPFQVKFRVVVQDNAMNTAVTAEVTYNVVAASTGSWLQDNLLLVAGAAAVVMLLLILIACRKRR